MSKQTVATIGRPPLEPPVGHVTMQQAADQTGVSYTTVHRYAQAGFIANKKASNGTISVPKKALVEIKKRAKARASTAEKHAVMLRPDKKRYAAWAKAAGGKRLSQWIAGLADRAASRAKAA